MKKTIIITSIYPPNEAIEKFASIGNLIVVGDRKTPKDWQYPGVDFISIDEQMSSGSEFNKLLPEGIYARKNCGYTKAIQEGADIIIDTDDDNIPYSNWDFPSFDGQFDCLPDNLGMVNVYQLFSKQKIWPRGLELNLINKDFGLEDHLSKREAKIGVWQGLADKDPDVDAIYRLTCDEECVFDKREPIVLGKGTLSPYNSQNTITVKELFPLLYLPFTVSFRFTDILRSWVAQPIMWRHGYKLGFTQASVYQERNPHDYFQDFLLEIPMFQNQARAIEISIAKGNDTQSISDNLFNIYTALAEEGIVHDEEIPALETWLKEIGQ